ncbi:MAG: 6-bladed beta-propeller [Alphaproteobacteria bacterium]
MDSQIVILPPHRYSVERDWGRLPGSAAEGLPSQVAVDADDRVHYLLRAQPAVHVFSRSGEWLFAYGDDVEDAHGIYRDPLNRIFVTDRDAHQVLVFDADGGELFRIGERHRPEWRQPFSHPCDVAVAADGRIFVADGYGNARVHRFDPEGRYEMSWGELGRGAGEFMTPHAIWVDPDGRVLVADRENGRVQRFTTEGMLIDALTGLQNPMDIWGDDEGRIYVTDQLPSLVLFSSAGSILGRCRPSLNGAHGLFGDSGGNLFLAEMNPPSLTRMGRLD